MYIKSAERRTVNKIAAKYCHNRVPMSEIQNFYNELEALGVTVGMLSNGQRSCEWYVDGKEVENSQFVYSVYKPENSNNVEFTIYFS